MSAKKLSSISNICGRKHLRYLPPNKLNSWIFPLHKILLTFSCSVISGTIRSLHHSQHSRTLHRMRLPSLHVIDAFAQLSHFLHTLYELLHSKLFEEKVACDQKDWLKSFAIEIELVPREFSVVSKSFYVNLSFEWQKINWFFLPETTQKLNLEFFRQKKKNQANSMK